MSSAVKLSSRSSLLDHTYPVCVLYMLPSIQFTATIRLSLAKAFYACYLLKSIKTPKSQVTYVGSTPNPPKASTSLRVFGYEMAR